jgi:hypothetical protein
MRLGNDALVVTTFLNTKTLSNQVYANAHALLSEVLNLEEKIALLPN